MNSFDNDRIPMEKEQYLQHLLQSKLPQSTEVELHLFEYCNLNCTFCGQDHDSKEGMNTIVEKANQVIEFIKKSPLKSHNINIMGGEIFNDDIPDSVFVDYLAFCTQIADVCRARGHTVRFNFVTNLIFRKNIENVQYLLLYVENSFISTSYDFAGRGLDINRSMLFKENLERFKDRVGAVGFVLTRPAIRKLIDNKDKYFKEHLYPNFPLYFDWYVPEGSAEKMLPSDQEMLDAFLYVAEHYPKINPVADLLTKTHNEMTCYSLYKTTILPTGKEVTCRYLEYKPEQFLTPIDVSTNADIIERHLDANECMSCKWFDRCSFRCFVQADWARLERLPTCFLKTFFDKTVGQHESQPDH